jgi:hypothetical protein
VTTPLAGGGGGEEKPFCTPTLYPHRRAADSGKRQSLARKPILLTNALFANGKRLLKF